MFVSCLEKITCSLPFFGPVFAATEIIDAHDKAEDQISQAASLHSTALSVHDSYSRRGAASPDRSDLQTYKMEALQRATAHLETKRVYCICGIIGNILSIAIVSLVALSIFPLIAAPFVAAPFILWAGAYIYGIYQTNKSFEHIKRLEPSPS